MISSLNSVTDSMVLQTPAGAKKWEQAEKHRARARAYYLRNREAVKERSLQRYYSAQEEQKEEQKRAEETTVIAEETAEMHAGTVAEKAEKPEKTEIVIGIWGDVVIIGMITAAVIWVAVLVIREWQGQPEASEALQKSNTSSAPQEPQIPAAQLSALIEREKNFAEIRRLAGTP